MQHIDIMEGEQGAWTFSFEVWYGVFDDILNVDLAIS